MKGYINYIKRSLIVIATSIVMTAIFALPAFAHVGIDPSTGSQGGYGTYTLKVPNEDATSSTVKVEIQFSDDSPFAAVRVMPKPGWSYTIAKKKLEKSVEINGASVDEVVSTITWEGGKIAPGEFDEFKISMGPLPEIDSIVLKALQTYDNGNVVRWIDETVEGQEEPEHPAPTIMLSKAVEGEDAHGNATTSVKDSDHDAASEKNEDSKTLEYVGVGLGAVALVVALGAFLKKK